MGTKPSFRTSEFVIRCSVMVSQSFTLAGADYNKMLNPSKFAIASYNQDKSVVVGDIALPLLQDLTADNYAAAWVSNPSFRTETTGCGVVDGSWISATSIDQKFTWDDVKGKTLRVNGCTLNEKCSTNADCAGIPFGGLQDAGIVVCQDQKCTFKPQGKAILSSSNASVASIVFVVVLATFALLF
jgi:hypothetical protein